MKRFDEKLVVLSGAAAGIGYSTALRLADEGAILIVIDYDAIGIEALKKKLNSSIFETYVHDISDEEGTKKITTETGAGQWGSSLAFACSIFKIELYSLTISILFISISSGNSFSLVGAGTPK